MFHPTSIFLVAVAAVVATQFLGPVGLGLSAVALALGGRPVIGAWWRMLRRMRWLAACAWLVVAYGVPGEAIAGFDWLPTREGAVDANLHIARLALMLGVVSWMLARLGTAGLTAALLGACGPWAARGGRLERFPVRLALVMEHLQQPAPAGAWRAMLDGRVPQDAAAPVLRVELPAWRAVDILLSLAAAALLFAALRIG